jgi:hypothetical protein
MKWGTNMTKARDVLIERIVSNMRVWDYEELLYWAQEKRQEELKNKSDAYIVYEHDTEFYE